MAHQCREHPPDVLGGSVAVLPVLCLPDCSTATDLMSDHKLVIFLEFFSVEAPNYGPTSMFHAAWIMPVPGDRSRFLFLLLFVPLRRRHLSRAFVTPFQADFPHGETSLPIRPEVHCTDNSGAGGLPSVWDHLRPVAHNAQGIGGEFLSAVDCEVTTSRRGCALLPLKVPV
jgi:hypothetical protein